MPSPKLPRSVKSKSKASNVNRRQQLINARRQELLNAYRMNYKLRKNRFTVLQEYADNMEYFVAIGHGEHRPLAPPVLVPENVFLVFTTAAGYWGSLADSLDPKFLDIVASLDKIKRLVKGTLQPNEIPTFMQRRKWDWRNHIYPPRSTSMEHALQFYDPDKGNPSENKPPFFIHTAFDNIAGLYHVPDVNNRFFYNKQPEVTLSEILNKASHMAGNKMCMVFVSGCRGDPRISNQQEAYMSGIDPITGRSRKSLLITPQTYPIVRTPSNRMGQVANYERYLKSFMMENKYNENSIKREVRNLPSGSRRMPSETNIKRFGLKYVRFLRSKKVSAREYIRNVLFPRRNEMIGRMRSSLQAGYERRKQQRENFKKEINRRIKLKRTASVMARIVRLYRNSGNISIVPNVHRQLVIKILNTLQNINRKLKSGNTRNINSIINQNHRNIQNSQNKQLLTQIYKLLF